MRQAEESRETAESMRAAEFATWESEIDSKADRSELSNYAGKTEIAQSLAAKQNRLTTTADLHITDDEIIGLTDMAKKRLFIDLWNAAAGTYGTYNSETGFFELNGLTLTYDEALAVLDAGHVSLDYANARFSGYKGRTVLPLKRGINPSSKYLFQNAINLEVVDVDLMPVDDGTFKGCRSLRRITGVIQWNKYTKQSFAGCAALEEISDLRINTATVDLSESPALTLQTLTVIVQKCTAAESTIPVHADVYAKLTDTANTQWHAVLTAAAAKNISFATI